MLFAKFTTICAATNCSLGIVNCFYEKIKLLTIDPFLIADGCCMTVYATANVPSKVASQNA